MQKNSGLDQLIYLFSKLPGLGSRSARRIVLHLLQNKDLRLRGLIDGLEDAANKITVCKICNNLDYEELCSVCSDYKRNDEIITIVETVAELWALERGGFFKGRYHVLGTSTNRGCVPDAKQLKLDSLKERCRQNNTKEIIIATNATLDGQTSAYFITEYFKDQDIYISRLASGIPIGGELDYLDEGTLSAAIESRKEFS